MLGLNFTNRVKCEYSEIILAKNKNIKNSGDLLQYNKSVRHFTYHIPANRLSVHVQTNTAVKFENTHSGYRDTYALCTGIAFHSEFSICGIFDNMVWWYLMKKILKNVPIY